ncbi:MAG TPA: hypothetical protein VE673_19245, partial [Pseudonocardiaceae bacterium]|nr:hypothetical protein [Pseudonocardiaceae bacterium]
MFHLAIPAANLADAHRFYVEGLGCSLARRYPDRITLNFFGDQVVCHLSSDIDPLPRCTRDISASPSSSGKAGKACSTGPALTICRFSPSHFGDSTAGPRATTRSSCAIPQT